MTRSKMFLNYHPNGKIVSLSSVQGERAVRAPDFFIRQIEVDPGVINSYQVVNGALIPERFMKLPELAYWKQEKIAPGWLAAIALSDQEVRVIINQEHPNGRHLIESGEKVYLERDGFVIESHYLRDLRVCKYLKRSSVKVCSLLFDGDLFFTTLDDINSYL